MIKCQNCYYFLYCDKRSFDKDYCNGYKQMCCRSCASYPFCEKCISPSGTCDDYKTKKIIKRYYGEES